jgi:hypothetical protein
MMTHLEKKLARARVCRFFPRLPPDCSVRESTSYDGGQKHVEVEVAADPRRLKGIVMDFEHEVGFNLQLVSRLSNTVSSYFVETDGADSNYFYAYQPGIHAHWAAETKFIPPDGVCHLHMRVDIPWLRENGMGLFFFDKDERSFCSNAESVTFCFTFHDPGEIPDRFTVHMLR